ncbi:MAG: hypothetical protein AAF845_05820 [Bacteroidota bacterium]
MRSWFTAGLLDWAARCDVSGRPEAASEAVALARHPTAVPPSRIRALAASIEAAGDATLAAAVRRLASETA